mmetsp:Transcript_34884/g.64556  ORF Transcript_34884/g.64556 Transcript_34884/m.64556 type:complete len:86 (-) Transcript_34884:478-735(-)
MQWCYEMRFLIASPALGIESIPSQYKVLSTFSSQGTHGQVTESLLQHVAFFVYRSSLSFHVPMIAVSSHVTPIDVDDLCIAHHEL